MSLLGIDVGTTGCKAAAFSLDGECIASAYREYPMLHPGDGLAELDSVDVFTRIRQCVAEVARATSSDPITALSVSSMGEAMVPVSRDREILGNSILMVDLRGSEYVDRLRERIGQEEFYEINPNILGPNYSLPKLLWVRDNQPDVWKRTWKFLNWGDLVPVLLGGEPVASHTLVNRTLLYDIRREDWSDRLLELTGLDREKLPRPVHSGTDAGTVSDAIADEFGLPRGVRMIVGGHDQGCNSLGAGIHEAGKAVCGMGTFECITPAYDHIPPTAEMLPRGLNVEHHVIPGLYVSFIFNQSGSLVRWFRDTFASADRKLLREGEDIYDVLTAEMPADPTRLLVLPHFEITGTPDFVTDSAGVIAGLKNDTTRGEILKAIMEGATFYFVEGIDGLREVGIDMRELVATGGGAKSDAWLQIKADILGVPFVRPRITECTILGAAMLAGIATGALADPADATRRFVVRERVFEPDRARHERYREQHELYRRLYPALKDIQARLSV